MSVTGISLHHSDFLCPCGTTNMFAGDKILRFLFTGCSEATQVYITIPLNILGLILERCVRIAENILLLVIGVYLS